MKRRPGIIGIFIPLLSATPAAADTMATIAATMLPREFAVYTVPMPPEQYMPQNSYSYADNGAWDPINRRTVWVTGSGVSGGGTQQWWMVEHYVDTDTWVQTEFTWWFGDAGHSYNGTAVNPNNGDVYFQRYGESAIYVLASGLDPSVQANWTTLPSFFGLLYAGIYEGYNHDSDYNATMQATTGNAIAWHDGLNCLVAVMGGNRLACWDGTDWKRLPVTGMGSWNNMAVYLPSRGALWFGGGPFGEPTFLLQSDFTIQQLPTPPYVVTAGTIEYVGPVGIARTFNFSDPVSGNPLLFVHQSREMWELDLDTMEWIEFTAEVTQPTVGWPAHSKYCVVRHDINAILCNTARHNDKHAYLYRHNGGTPPPPPPPPDPDPDPGQCP